MQLSPRGQIALASGERDIEQAIRIVLGTMPGERVMRPEFGCRVRELLFAPRNAATRALLIRYVQQALERWDNVVDDPGNDGAWLVEINYVVKTTHDRRSLVYPFYILDEEAT
jgi:phage baseplate assembly protein W